MRARYIHLKQNLKPEKKIMRTCLHVRVFHRGSMAFLLVVKRISENRCAVHFAHRFVAGTGRVLVCLHVSAFPLLFFTVCPFR